MSIKITIKKEVLKRDAEKYARIWKSKTKDGKFVLWLIRIDNGHSVTSFSVNKKQDIFKRIKEEVRL